MTNTNTNDDRRWRHVDVEKPEHLQPCWVVSQSRVVSRFWTSKGIWFTLECEPDVYRHEFWMPRFTPNFPTESEMQAARE